MTTQPVRPQLWRASEIDRGGTQTSSLYRTLLWLREFIMQPHPNLGRPGPVCPFTPMAQQLDTIWMAEVADEDPSMESIAAIVTEYRDVFLATEPTAGRDAIYKVFLVVFPALAQRGGTGAAFVDEVQQRLKKYFVDMGLMIGEFHAGNESPGLRNPDFRPLRSPIPMLAIRHMVDTDLPFLARAEYPAIQRCSFLRSYLSRLSSTLNPARFDQALNCLIVAEIELWIDRAKAGNAPALSAMFRARHDREASMSTAP